MSWFIVIGLSLIFIVQIFIFACIITFVDRIRRLEPKIALIEAWVITASPNRHSISGRPMTPEEKEEDIGSVEAIPQKKADVPS